MGLKNIIKWNQLYTCYEPHAVHINFLVVCVYIYNGTLTLNITWVVVIAGVSSSTFKTVSFVFLNITYELQTL